MAWLAPLAVAGLVMLPRLASPQFGLLDDGLTLQTGREVLGRWSTVLHLIPETGRFFPAYWLVYSAIFGVVGARPLGFLAVNIALLAGLLAVLVRLVRSSGGTPRQAAVAVVLFASCGPTIESFYTLSKAEPLQLAWIAGSLLATAAALGAVGARRAGLLVVAAGALLLAHATKETSLVLVPISLGWLAVERWSSREPGPFPRFAVTYLAINLVAAAAFVVLRWSYARVSPLPPRHGGLLAARPRRLRPFRGLENFVAWRRLERWCVEADLEVLTHLGFHPWPFHLGLPRAARAVERWLTRGRLARLMVNQAVGARKRG